jgi:hypothetical protein
VQDLAIDASGTSALLPAEGHWFYVRAVGDGDLVTPWTHLTHDQRDVVLTLAPGAPLTGRIVAASGREPIAGAQVTFTEGGSTPEGSSESSNLVVATRTTGADGAFAPVIVPRGRAATLFVTAERFADRERAVWIPPAGDVAAVTVAMEPGGSVSGVVRTPDGSPLPGARVGVVTRQYIDPAGESSILTLSDRPAARSLPDGTFRISGLKLDVEWHLVAIAENWAGSRASDRVVLTADLPDGRMDVVVRAPARLDVLVVDAEGRPVPGAEVTWEEGGMVLSVIAKEVEPGRHRFDGLDPCSVPLTVTARGFAPVNEIVEIHEAERRELVVRMSPPVEIRGRLVDDLGRPVPHARLRWSGAEHFSWALDGATKTAEDGAFVASGLRAERYRFDVDSGDVVDTTSTVAAPANDVIIRIVRSGAIVFRLRLPPGTPRPGDLTCSIPDGSGTAQTFGDGWRVDELSAGRRKIVVRVPGYDAVPIEADVLPGADTDAGERPLVVSATWRGRVVDAGGRPIAGALVQRYRDVGWPVADTSPARTDADGRFVVEHVDTAPETYVVQAAGFADDRPRIGSTALPESVTLRRGSLVTVQAVDADGRPAPGGLLRALLAGTGDEDNETLRWITIDERGRGTVRLPPGRWRLGTGGSRWTDVETSDGIDVAVDVAE